MPFNLLRRLISPFYHEESETNPCAWPNHTETHASLKKAATRLLYGSLCTKKMRQKAALLGSPIPIRPPRRMVCPRIDVKQLTNRFFLVKKVQFVLHYLSLQLAGFRQRFFPLFAVLAGFWPVRHPKTMSDPAMFSLGEASQREGIRRRPARKVGCVQRTKGEM
jgi:hypothetical protein